MAIAGVLNVLLGANTAGFARDMKKAGNVVEDFESRTKAMFGNKSLLKDAFEIFAGGGAIAGLTFGIRAVGEMAEKTQNVVDLWRDARVGVGEFTIELGKVVPVVGDVLKATEQWANVWFNILTGVKQMPGLVGAATKRMEDERRVGEALAQKSAKLGQQATLAELPEGRIKEMRKAWFDLQNQLDEVRKSEEAVKARGVSTGTMGALKEIDKQRAALTRIYEAELTKIETKYSDMAAERRRQALERWYKTMTGGIGDALESVGDWFSDVELGRVKATREEVEKLAEATAQFADLTDPGQLAMLAAREAGIMRAASMPVGQAMNAAMRQAPGQANQNTMATDIREMKSDLRVLRQKVEVG